MRYRVKPYECYIEYYPGTEDFKNAFTEGSVIDLAEVDERQLFKLEKFVESDTKKENLQSNIQTPELDLKTNSSDNTSENKEDVRKKAQEFLRNGKK